MKISLKKTLGVSTSAIAVDCVVRMGGNGNNSASNSGNASTSSTASAQSSGSTAEASAAPIDPNAKFEQASG